MAALGQKRSYRGLARIDSRGWQRNYAPNRLIFTYVRPFRSDLVRLVMTAIAYLAGLTCFFPMRRRAASRGGTLRCAGRNHLRHNRRNPPSIYTQRATYFRNSGYAQS